MKDLNEDSFGLLIAFLLPGFIMLWGLSFASPVVATWLTTYSEEHGVAVGGFLYASLASLELGLLISAVRWLIIDHLLEWRGIHGKGLQYQKLKDKETLKSLAKAGTPTAQVAKKLGRTAAAVQQKAMRAGISFRAAKRSGARKK